MGDIMKNDIMIENFMKVIMDYKKKYGVNATRFEFDEKIISMNNPKLSYFFKIVIGSDRKEHDVIVASSEDISLLYNYAVKAKDIDINIIEDALIKTKIKVSKDSYKRFVLLFIKDVKDCDKEKLYNELNCIKKERKLNYETRI